MLFTICTMQIKNRSLKVKYFRDTSVSPAVSKSRGSIISLYMIPPLRMTALKRRSYSAEQSSLDLPDIFLDACYSWFVPTLQSGRYFNRSDMCKVD